MFGVFPRKLASLTCAAVLAVSVVAARGWAAGPEFVTREWHIDDGLPNEDVYQVFQDRTGYLWVACRNVLCRFDGTTFAAQFPRESRGIFYSVAEDSDGSLLLAGRDGDNMRVRGGTFTREQLPAPFTGRPVGAVLRAADGALWYALRGAALRIADGRVQAFGAEVGLAGDNWTRLATDGAGDVWVANHGFLARYEHGRLVRVPLEADANELRVVSSRRDGPWLINASQVLKFDAQRRAVVVAEVPQLLTAHYVNAALEDRSGALWLGTRSAGLQRLSGGTVQPVALPADHVTTLFEDRDNVLWVGTAAGGLSAVAPRVCTLYGKSAGIVGAVQAVCVDDAGELWAANGDAGVVRFRNGEFERSPLRRNGKDFAAGSVSRRSGGGVWATGGTGSALFAVTDDGREPAMLEDLDAGRIHANTFTTRAGELWFATADRRVGRLKDGQCRMFGASEGIGTKGIRTFAEPTPGKLLAGTNDGELLQFDGVNFVPMGKPLQLPSALNAILALDDELWLGTAGHGLAIRSGAGRVAFLGTDHGLPDDSVTQLVPDERGFVWCGSARGVFRLGIEEVRRFVRGETTRVFPLRLGKDEGVGVVLGQGIYGPGAARGRDGRIWFASRQGVLAVDPSAETLTQPLPKARIEEVLADEVAQPLTLGPTWNVNPDARKLELRFSVLCLSAPSRVLVRYRLVNFDTGWRAGKPGEPATYPRLPAGRYRFEVAASFDDTTEPSAIDALEIAVPPRWWQTWWFVVSAALLAAAGVALVVRAWSHRRLRRRIANLEREAAVARVRERIARDIHDDVGASLTRISLLAHRPTPDSREAAALAEIDETAREVTRSLDEIVWAVNPQYDSLEGVAIYLTNFAQKFLGAAKIRCRLLVPPSLPAVAVSGDTRHDLFLCFREVLNNVVKHAQASEVVVRLTFAAPSLEIVVQDDGRGLSAARAAGGASPDRVASGNGLENLRRRMARLGGSCAIESSTAGGTCVTLRTELRTPPAPPTA